MRPRTGRLRTQKTKDNEPRNKLAVLKRKKNSSFTKKTSCSKILLTQKAVKDENRNRKDLEPTHEFHSHPKLFRTTVTIKKQVQKLRSSKKQVQNRSPTQDAIRNKSKKNKSGSQKRLKNKSNTRSNKRKQVQKKAKVEGRN